MAVSEATLSLLIKAQDLAGSAIGGVASSLEGMAGKASDVAGRVTGAFRGMGDKVANSMGMIAETLASGGSLSQGLMQAGVFMAGQLVESFGGQVIEKIAGSSLLGAITAPLAALGSAAGGVISAAIPIGMALLPVIIVGAIVAAIAVLIVSPEIRGKVFAFVGGLLEKIGAALASLGKVLGDAFGTAWKVVTDAVPKIIGTIVGLWLALPSALAGLGLRILGTIIDGLAGLPGRVADIVRNAFAGLRLDIGPFHIDASGVRVDLPKIDLPKFAGGVTNFRGGLAVVGERGPELVRLPRGADVIANHRLASTADTSSGPGVSVRLVGVSADELVDVVERGLYLRLQRAAT